MMGGHVDITVLAGALLILAAGALQGTFAVPMKYARKWNHENIWLVFAFTGLVLFPWLLTSATVPSLGHVYSSTSSPTLWAIIASGLAWGVGATLTGIGLKMIGIGLGLAVVLGLSASVGSLVPLLVLSPHKVFTLQGGLYLLGTCVMFAGIALVAVAGALREKSEQASGSPGAAGAPFLVGLLVAVAAGILSSALNFSYAFGTEAIEHARRLGASSVWAPNVVAVLATTGGFLANLAYCTWRFYKNSSGRLYFSTGSGSHWIYGALMGGFWFGGLAVYGMGLSRMGSFGTVAGWPLLMGTIIIASNLAGLLTGEWARASARSKAYLFRGVFVILGALAVLAAAQQA